MNNFKRLFGKSVFALLSAAMSASVAFSSGIDNVLSQSVQSIFVVDYDGDLRADLAWQALRFSDSNRVTVTHIDHAQTHEWPSDYLMQQWDAEHRRWVIGDFNGDGKSDWLLQPQSEFAETAVIFNGETVHTLPMLELGFAWNTQRHTIAVGDFNGDGYDDLWMQGVRNRDRHALLLANKNGEFLRASVDFDDAHLALDWSADRSTIVVGDFNADGQSDWLLQDREQNAIAIVTSARDGSPSTVTQPGQALSRAYSFSGRDALLLAGDFDGDGSDELLRLGKEENQLAQFFDVHDGNLSETLATIGPVAQREKLEQVLVGDFNADGADEVILIMADQLAPVVLSLKSDAHTKQTLQWWLQQQHLLAANRTATWAVVSPTNGINDVSRIGSIFLSPTTTTPSSNSFAVEEQSMSLQAMAGADYDTPFTTVAGALAGQASNAGGSASYHLPLVVPPGRNGMQPSLTLNYNSEAANGVLGRGWSIAAGSNISRCGSLFEKDNYLQSVQLNDNDRLCLDGKLLVLWTGQYGKSGAVYRTEMESFVRVKQTGDWSSNSSYFTVADSSGRTRIYGDSSDSRLLRKDASNLNNALSVPVSWAVHTDTDLFGNIITYEYAALDLGNQYLSTIYYTGKGADRGDRKVEFVYTTAGQTRGDVRSSFQAGGLTLFTRLLRQIKTSVNGDWKQTYDFVYESKDPANAATPASCGLPATATPAMRHVDPTQQSCAAQLDLARTSRLVGVRQCAPDNAGNKTCLNETTFNWNLYNAVPGTSTSQASWATTDVSRWKGWDAAGDIDGDGRSDRVYWASPVVVELSKNGQTYTLSTEVTAEALITQWSVGGDLVDIDNDGLLDIVALEHDLSATPAKSYVRFYRWNGSGFVKVTPVDDASSVTLNANARCAMPSTGTSTQRYYRAPYNGGTGDGAADPESGLDLSCRSHFVDANGDGRIDMVVANTMADGASVPNNQNVYWRLYLNKTTTAGTARFVQSGSTLAVKPAVVLVKSDSVSSSFAAVDVDGDGIVSLLGEEEGSGNTCMYEADCLKSFRPIYRSEIKFNNSGGVISMQQIKSATVSASEPVMYADFNGDGLSDRIVGVSPSSNWLSALNTGKGFVKDLPYSTPVAALQNINVQAYFNYTGQPEANVYAMQYSKPVDFNHDGLTDLLVPNARVNQASCSGTCTEEIMGNAGRDILYDNEFDLYSWKLYESHLKSDGAIYFVQRTLNGFVAPLSDVQVIDIDGNGFKDLATRLGKTRSFAGFSLAMTGGYTPGFYVLLNGNDKADLLQSIDNGQQFKQKLDYVAGNLDSAVFSQSAVTQTWPTTRLSSRTRLLKSLEASNGVNALFNKTSFQYFNPLYHVAGRGYLGMEKIIETTPRGLKVETTYRQAFPYTGMEITKYTYQTPLIRLIDITNTPDVVRPFGDALTWLPYVKQTTKIQKDLVGSDRGTETTQILSTDLLGHVTAKRVTAQDSLVTHVTESTAAFDLSNISASVSDWWPTRKTQEVQRQCLASGQCSDNAYSKAFYVDAWDMTHHLPTVTRSGHVSDVTMQIKTTVGFDAWGNVSSTSINSVSGNTGLSALTNARNSSVTFDSTGYFPASATNALGHSVLTQYDTATGSVTQSTDPLGNILNVQYDGFGRVLSKSLDGKLRDPTPEIYQYETVALAGSSAVQKMTVQQPGVKPKSVTYLDALNRVVRVEIDDVLSRGFNQVVDTTYDEYGHVISTSVPYFSSLGQAPASTRFDGFDLLDRPAHKYMPNDKTGELTLTYTYDGNKTTIQVGPDSAYSVYRIKNALGQWWEVQDQGSADVNGAKLLTTFRYDPNGNPTLISRTTAGGVTVNNTAHYNTLGQKDTMTDPERGTWYFNYNVLGELVKQQDAKAQYSWFAYDDGGRALTRKESLVDNMSSAPVIASWSYNKTCVNTAPASAPANLTLCNSSKTGEVNTGYQYDQQGALTQTNYDFIGSGKGVLSVKQHYDAQNRPDITTYPTDRVTAQTVYNPQGFAYQQLVVASGVSQTLNTIQDVDAFGNVRQSQGGNGLYTKRNYSDKTGRELGVCVDRNGSCQSTSSNAIQALQYDDYDDYGNLLSQINSVQGVKESFSYDRRQRLISSTRAANIGNGFTALTTTVNYSYDQLGNLLNKSDFAANLLYTTVGKPHQVKDAKDASNNLIASYVYDNNGNMTSSSGQSQYTRTLNYNQQMLPTSVIRGSNNSTFNYNENNERYYERHVDGSKTTVSWKIGKAFELNDVTESGVTKTEHKFYVGHAQYVWYTTTSCGNWRYLHSDRLGSIETITNQSGDVIERHGFDPFGKPRNANWMLDKTNTLGVKGLFSRITTRGYTGHDHVDGVGLIHMNGRAYDPDLGRFTGVDPFISSPLNAQALNPYSYANNNPYKYTDPDGRQSRDLEHIYKMSGATPPPGSPNDRLGPAIGVALGVVMAPAVALIGTEVGVAALANPAATATVLETTAEITGVGTGATVASNVAKTEVAAGVAGGKITGHTRHGLNQSISRNDGKGVSAAAKLDAVNNPKKVVEQAEGATKYVGKDATVVTNSEGKVITTYGKPRDPNAGGN